MPAYVPRNETIRLSIKPGVLSVPLRALGASIVLAAAGAGAWFALPSVGWSGYREGALIGGGVLMAARWLWEIAVWASRRYVLTDRRIMSVSGVLRRQVREVPLNRVQNCVLDRTLGERLLGLGTIGVASAGGAWIEVAWVMVARSSLRLGEIRDALRSAGGPGAPDGLGAIGVSALGTEREDTRERASGPMVIGLAGGIGSGKSAVAGILRDLGCAVIDSDAEARRALGREDVKKEIVSWWGEGILDGQGSIDRARVAEIVFADPDQRGRLEGLIHPLVKRSRAQFIASTGDVRAIVIDAPLLFEAGVDAECDGVIFVDAPREVRLARVRETRGWDEAELARREDSQMSIWEKRSRADKVVENAGTLDELREGVAQALRQMEGLFSGRSARGVGARPKGGSGRSDPEGE